MEKINIQSSIVYLESIIESQETDSEIHELLIKSYVNQKDERYYVKLNNFLTNSTKYRPSHILDLLNSTSLYIPCAIVLGKLKRHNEALEIYINKLSRFDLAELYCTLNYNSRLENVYNLLLIKYAKLPDSKRMFDFVDKYGAFLSINVMLECLPLSIPLSDLLDTFVKSIRKQENLFYDGVAVRCILDSKLNDCKIKLLCIQEDKVLVDEDSMCFKCLKRIQNSIFCYSQDKMVSHVHCEAVE